MIMNPLFLTMKVVHKMYSLAFPMQQPQTDLRTPDEVSETIFRLLTSDNPCMIARFGSVELIAITNYIGVKHHKGRIWEYITNKVPQWWWNDKSLEQMKTNAGFFPLTKENIVRFSEMMLEEMHLVDLLGSWRQEEKYVSEIIKDAIMVPLLTLEPYWAKNPWSWALEGKHVLVVHPFAEDIISQYENHREQLFEDKRVLPKFASLRVVKAVQSLGGESNGFHDWFEALDWMKKEMDKSPYDVALIGCGAYGFPLAAYAKRTGHKALHLGGALQLMFGIKGKRWANPNYNKIFNYNSIFNDYWTYPMSSTRPLYADRVEDACYWA